MIIALALVFLFNVAQLPDDNDGNPVCTFCFLVFLVANVYVIINKPYFWNCCIMGYASIVAIMIAKERNNQLGQTLNFALFLFCCIMAILNY